MANTEDNKQPAKPLTAAQKRAASQAKAAAAKPVSQKESEQEEQVVEPAREEKPEKKPVPKDIDPSKTIFVVNGFQGRLIYKSKRTGEKFVWEEFGDEQEMELRELRNAKSSSKKMFANNWFMFDEDWVIDYLGVGQYYKHAININEFDDLFDMDVDDLVKKISALSSGQKNSVSYRARQLIAEDKIDSRKVIHALESVLGVELVER